MYVLPKHREYNGCFKPCQENPSMYLFIFFRQRRIKYVPGHAKMVFTRPSVVIYHLRRCVSAHATRYKVRQQRPAERDKTVPGGVGDKVTPLAFCLVNSYCVQHRLMFCNGISSHLNQFDNVVGGVSILCAKSLNWVPSDSIKNLSLFPQCIYQ